MDAANHTLNDNSQQLLSRVLKAAADKKQVVIAEITEWDKAKVSKVLSCQQAVSIDDALLLIAACDLALIPAPNGATVTVPADHYKALMTLASERMSVLQKGVL